MVALPPVVVVVASTTVATTHRRWATNRTIRATIRPASYRAVSCSFTLPSTRSIYGNIRHSLILVFHQSENSSEQYTDFGGTDLLTFFRDTLNKNPKDRHILLKIEKDMMDFVQDKK